jgi:methylmalonyl-CoA/ethylmalonyl-CoA epimerase
MPVTLLSALSPYVAPNKEGKRFVNETKPFRRYVGMSKQEPTVKLSEVKQIGIIVKDLDRAIEFYSSHFGLGPFQVQESEVEFTYRGEQSNCRMRVAFSQWGSIQIELIQPLEGKSPLTEFLREKGEGVQHLRFDVDDLDGVLARLSKEGIEPVLQFALPDLGITFALLDTAKIGGVQFELTEMRGKSAV